MLSVIIITHNEARNIEACLQSVTFADEIIVLDNHSSDNTRELARRYTDKVYLGDKNWPGFGAQKNRALSYASSNWVLSIDADERVPPALRDEILVLIHDDKTDAAFIPRQSRYCGKIISHSGWQPDFVLRLFKREGCRFSDDLVHEKVIIPNCFRILNLKHPLDHYSFANLEEVLDKINRYSTANAQKTALQGKKSSLGKAIVHGLWAFFRSYFLRLGFLDGREGFMLAVSNAEGTYYHYLKLMYLQS